MWWFRTLSLGLAAWILGACGFQPLYGGKVGARITGEMAAIQILPIKDRVGQLLHNALLDRLNPHGRPREPAYFLIVKLSETKQGMAIRKTKLATRANLHFQAAFTLSAKAGKAPSLHSGTSVITTSYNILSADFANLMAEKDARRRAVREISADIANRLAVYFQFSRKRK